MVLARDAVSVTLVAFGIVVFEYGDLSLVTRTVIWPFGFGGLLVWVLAIPLMAYGVGRLGEVADDLEDTAELSALDPSRVRSARNSGLALLLGGPTLFASEFLYVIYLTWSGLPGGIPMAVVPSGILFCAVQTVFWVMLIVGAAIFKINRTLLEAISDRAVKYSPLA